MKKNLGKVLFLHQKVVLRFGILGIQIKTKCPNRLKRMFKMFPKKQLHTVHDNDKKKGLVMNEALHRSPQFLHVNHDKWLQL